MGTSEVCVLKDLQCSLKVRILTTFWKVLTHLGYESQGFIRDPPKFPINCAGVHIPWQKTEGQSFNNAFKVKRFFTK